MSELPAGTVTFLFTDLEGSTRLWEQHPDAMRAALARHDEILRDAVAAHRGHVVKATGDGLLAAFPAAQDALGAAASAEALLGSEAWEATGPLWVRMGVHTGGAELRDGDYFGPAVNRAARLMQAASGGQVLVSLATEELVRDSLEAGFGLVELGEHRLRDLSRPERVFQLIGPGLRSEFGPLRSLDVLPCNLPAQLTSFVGRGAELEELLAELESTRVVTLTGVGGVGKTRLALQVAAEALPRFGDGVWLVELGPIGEPSAVVEVMAATLGIQQHQGRTLDETLVEALRTKRMLLVLDNCEHLLDASARLVADLVSSCPGIHVLATSREALEVPGERARRVPSLPLPAASGSVEDVAQSDATRLFVERAGAVRAGFALNAETAPPVVQICERLDGIPLAIELAAARVASMHPSDIAARLGERFRLLTGGRRTVVERHQTLRATVDWSYDLLNDGERLVFDRLGVFAGGFTLGAAEAVVGDDRIAAGDVVDVLDTLVARSMVALDEAASETRYELLETMRQYARERLDATDAADPVRARHASYYLSFARAAGPALLENFVVWVGRVEADLDNLRAAFTWGLDAGEADVALGIPTAFWWDAQSRPYWGMGRWALAAASQLNADDHPLLRPALGVAIGFSINTGDLETANRCWAKVLDLESARSLAPEYISRFSAAAAAGYADRLEDGIQLAEEALDAARAAGDDSAVILVEATLVAYRWMAGDRSRAIELAESVSRDSEPYPSSSVRAFALYSLGYALQDSDPNRSAGALREGAEMFGQLRATSIAGLCLMVLARVEATHGDPLSALQSCSAATRQLFEIGHRTNTIFSLKNSVTAFHRARQAETAAVLLGWIDEQPLRGTAGQEADLYRRQQAQVRGQLGDDRYQELSQRGAAMSYEDMVEYALEQADSILAHPEAVDIRSLSAGAS